MTSLHNTSSNTSQDESPQNEGTPPPNITFLCILGVMAFVAVLANSMICILFLTRRKLRTISNVFLVSVAASDLCLGLFSVPLFIVEFFHPPLIVIGDSVLVYTLLATLSNLYAMTWDRYICITRPMKYVQTVSSRRVVLLIASCWIIPIPVTLTIQLLLHQGGYSMTSFKAIIGIFVGLIMLMSLFIVYAYHLILKIARRQLSIIELQIMQCSSNLDTNKQKRKARRNHKATITCAMVVLSFILCWFPTLIYDLITLTGYYSDYVDQYTLALALTNALSDPLIYAFHKSDFKYEITRLARRCCKKNTLCGAQSLQKDPTEDNLQSHISDRLSF